MRVRSLRPAHRLLIGVIGNDGFLVERSYSWDFGQTWSCISSTWRDHWPLDLVFNARRDARIVVRPYAAWWRRGEKGE